ncbi:KpsF/GutQ family sugar-phosphate isomerase [Leucothrix arctica]|uniref:Arabinose 5-phosphate isomerase n=1 Tax=Leucothrix arctica TaxID=1481894 RepID=A0A317CCP6_9GAMM|nr:KpsF/GutQ family sugar-phosphate isomerase [Leucothrix arctica]PWQ95891.1 D-arabinose 5-phosphate isomerase [Leucothrix arctica]
MGELRTVQQNDIIKNATKVISDEIEAIQELTSRLDDNFIRACETILNCKGRVIIAGMGKSGHIGHKIAATLASTGTPSFFVHPSEALHGDIGMITAQDIVITISNSGGTDELITLCSVIKRQGTFIIAMTGKTDSVLAKLAHCHINVGVSKEACPHNLAPTSSTTATLVMGDAIAVSLLKARAFTPEDFARSHPAGRLGKRLSIMVSDLMHSGEDMPKAAPELTLQDAILIMTGKQLGATLVVDADNKLRSVFTDGDLRRAFESGADLKQLKLIDVIQEGCHRITESSLAMQALVMMQEHTITVLPVVDENDAPVGIIHMHDLLKAGIV